MEQNSFKDKIVDVIAGLLHVQENQVLAVRRVGDALQILPQKRLLQMLLEGARCSFGSILFGVQI